MNQLNELRKLAGLTLVEAKTSSGWFAFNGIEKELPKLVKQNIKVTGLQLSGHGAVEARLEGDKATIQKYLAALWNVDPDGEEINDNWD